MVRYCTLFNPEERTVTFLNGQTYPLSSLRALGMGALLNSMFDFSEKLGTLRLEPEEMALFMAVVLVSAGETKSCLIPSFFSSSLKQEEECLNNMTVASLETILLHLHLDQYGDRLTFVT